MTAIHVIQTVGSIAERSGGPARTIRSLSEALARAGARVSLLAGHDPANDDGLLPPDAGLVDTYLVPVDRRLLLPRFDFARAMQALAPRSGNVIVHDNGIWSPSNLAVGSAARRLALPLAISPHGMFDPWAMAYHRGRKRVAWQLYQRRLIDQSVGLLATARRELVPMRALAPAKPIALIANGVDCPAVVPDRSARDAAMPRKLLYMSRIHPKKNLVGLVDAWALLAGRPEFAGWTLEIVGPDELGHAAEIAAQVQRLGLGASVRLGGPVAEADKEGIFAATDLFILPSFSENFGIVVAEALARGVPVIATDGSPWESLVTERCGWSVDTSPAAIAGAMAEAMLLPAAERRAMGVRGHAYVQRAFGWDGIAAQTMGYYTWLLQGGMAPDVVDRP